ncbi:thioesterase superfamily protein [Beauveria bassiana ARSEF 2860]|uniref:Thioesterase superfamily protein n=1 Tax=Beauveria bassiana (strain ARSEF 2860) TaxID=655819 RepID=J4UK45_BEAB2|nr:thioesterase superfamily protein [Beauveria bassiana ARSEF 2860]EJP64442.1 thioesterase superfamily protein [Beauveria bassiana ARSEF 2860]
MVFLRTPTITSAPISPEAKAAFGSRTSPLWCRQLLVDSRLSPVLVGWRTRDRARTKEDSYLSGVMNDPDTIGAWHTLYRPLPDTNHNDNNDDNGTSPLAGELLCLFSLGSGVNGHVDVAHGGVTAGILDVAMGTACSIFSTEGDSNFTLELNIRFKKPLATPGVYLCRAWLQKRTTGRKAWLQALIEDGNGEVYAESDAFWLDVPAKPKL